MNSFRGFILLLATFILTACIGTKAPITCSELSNRYNALEEHLSITLDTAKGHEELSEYIFKYDNIFQFNEDIDTYLLYLELLKVKKTDGSYINYYCHRINNAIQENNITVMLKEFKEIKYFWTEDYTKKIDKNSNKNIKFNVIDGCQEVASKLETYILTYKINTQSDDVYIILKDRYQNCLKSKKKKK